MKAKCLHTVNMNSTQTYKVQLRGVDNPHLSQDIDITGIFPEGMTGAEQYAYFLAAQYSARTQQVWYVAGVVRDDRNFVFNAHPSYWVSGEITVTEVA